MDRLLSRAQVGELLGVPSGTLAEWAYKGKGPAYHRVGRHVRYRLADVLAWLERHREPTGAP